MPRNSSSSSSSKSSSSSGSSSASKSSGSYTSSSSSSTYNPKEWAGGHHIWNSNGSPDNFWDDYYFWGSTNPMDP